MSYVTCTSFTTAYLFVVILYASLVIEVENRSVFGIGTRIIGDQLLMKDVLQTPPISLTEDPVIKFNYAIEEPITYIEIESEKNVFAVVNFSYEDKLVEGTIATLSGQPEPFEVVIQIYGFNETMLNVNPAYILNKDQQFNGLLKPNYQQQNHQSLSLMQEEFNAMNGSNDYDDDDNEEETVEDGGEDVDYDDDDFSDDYDKVIEQGQRQPGDVLVYETNQTSATSTETPTNHSVTFYYIDTYYITYVKFTIFEHYLDNPLENYVPPVVEYGHISPTTLKAIVTDHRTTSLFVRMQMYGFHPTALPVDYKPFLSNTKTSATTRPMSSLRQLKILMNAQQPMSVQQHQQLQLQHQQPQQQTDTNVGIQQQQQQQQQYPYELEQQISSSNNSHVNCLQQVLSSSSSPPSASSSASIGRDTFSIYTHWAILNTIVTIFIVVGFM